MAAYPSHAVVVKAQNGLLALSRTLILNESGHQTVDRK
jgi:hypothetical protein